MAHQLTKTNLNNVLPSESTCTVKEEQCEENDFIDDKVHVSETAVIVGNFEFNGHIRRDCSARQYGTSTILDNIKTELSSGLHCTITDHIKVEDGINAGDIKIELDNGLLYCDTCHAHYEDYCVNCGMLVQILNKNIERDADNKTQDQLPTNVLEMQESLGQLGIFALKVIPERVKFGPFTGIRGSECPLKIKGKKIVNKGSSKCLNWMQYINPARNTSEQNLLIIQCGGHIYYRSTRQILEGDELLVYFGEDLKDSLNDDFEMDCFPTTEQFLTDVYACTFCCLGFSSKSYLAKHKTLCLASAAEEFSIKELMQCPSCKIHLGQKEYSQHCMSCCCESEFIPLPLDNRTTEVKGRKTFRCRMYKCERCKYTTMYKGELHRHANRHNGVKMYKCGICNRRFISTESLRLHKENAHACVIVKEEPEYSIGDRKNTQTKPGASRSSVDMKQFKCSQCDFRTKYKAHIKRHVSAKHLKEYQYKCNKCAYKTLEKSLLIMHTKIKHIKTYDYKCDRCDYKTNRKWLLKRHAKTKHLKQFDYNCDLCDYATNVRWGLKVHLKAIHAKEFDYNCDLCEYGTSRRYYLEQHKKGKHFNEFAFKCESCEYRSNYKTRLRYHIKSRHLKVFDYKCDLCDYKTNAKRHLECHTQTKHLKEFKYKCELCLFKTNIKSGLQVHMRAQHLKCDWCEYRTVREESLKRHVRAQHLKEYDYECEKCNYKSSKKSNFEYHLKAKHLKQFDYKCQSCTFKTNTKSFLDRHVKAKHLKDFDYKCDVCDYRTNYKKSFEQHTKGKHLKQFDYQCDICDYKTIRKGNLGGHIRKVHLKEYDYTCVLCDYRTNKKSALTRHVNRRHLNEVDYKCKMCAYGTNRRSDLVGHVRRRHLEECEYNCDLRDGEVNRKS